MSTARSKIFSPVTVHWNGKVYTIPANEIPALGMKIEQIQSIPDLAAALAARKKPMFTIAACFGEALRWCGVQVQDEDILAALVYADGNEVAQDFGALLAAFVPNNPYAKEAATKAPDAGSAVGNQEQAGNG